ncbi:hypothetical protein NE237_004353 [Protea cynaroides]|uniref:Uncharacterized protein n=1 Tax=Protea cynaroides TaxID=273540 RepID=A0A9Q0KIR5_9MAGN|nr:hypothetical protein NE237_004353 [Protea cynaroides]
MYGLVPINKNPTHRKRLENQIDDPLQKQKSRHGRQDFELHGSISMAIPRRVMGLCSAFRKAVQIAWCLSKWASGMLSGVGVLEVKCPYNKGMPELALPMSTMPFYYMPQVQVSQRHEFLELINGIPREFWWENVVPIREALLLGKEKDVKTYRPAPTHKQAGLVISKSKGLVVEAKLTCRDIGGHRVLQVMALVPPFMRLLT